jgi:hypothetical protein
VGDTIQIQNDAGQMLAEVTVSAVSRVSLSVQHCFDEDQPEQGGAGVGLRKPPQPDARP